MSAAPAKGKPKDKLSLIATLVGLLVILTGFVGWVNATGNKADEALKKATAAEEQQKKQATKDDFNRLEDKFDELQQTVIRHIEAEHQR